MPGTSVKKNQSIAKAFKIIELMSDLRRQLKLQELSEYLKMPPSTVLRYLSSLMDLGYISQEKDTGRYFLTLKIANIGSKVKAFFPYREVLKPYLSLISTELDEASSLCVEEDMNVIYIETKEGPSLMLQALQRIGRIAPMYNTGTGKNLLLNYSQEEIIQFFSERNFIKFTENTIITIDELLKELENVRTQGYALDNEECEVGVCCIAGPVRDFSGKIVASLSVSMPTQRIQMKRERAIKIILKYCGEASRVLGWR